MLEHMKISNELLGFVLCYSLFSKPNACWVIAIYHYKNKFVVLTTEWLLWLQTNWRDSGYERFALGNRN